MSLTASRKAGRAILRKPWRNRRRNSPGIRTGTGPGNRAKKKAASIPGKRMRGMM